MNRISVRMSVPKMIHWSVVISLTYVHQATMKNYSILVSIGPMITLLRGLERIDNCDSHDVGLKRLAGMGGTCLPIYREGTPPSVFF